MESLAPSEKSSRYDNDDREKTLRSKPKKSTDPHHSMADGAEQCDIIGKNVKTCLG
jgi:hypothetical protein